MKTSEARKKQMREYSKRTRAARSAYQKEYDSNRRATDSLYKLKNILRTRLYYYFKVRSTNKPRATDEILGCDYLTIKEHLEIMFVKGMSWDNHGEWHIDHIIPLDSATTEEEMYKLCHYTNLQPLWAADNHKKSNIINAL